MFSSNAFFIAASSAKLELMRLADPRRAQAGDRPVDATRDEVADTSIGDELLAKAHARVAEAEERVRQGDIVGARELLETAAVDLRKHAPSSGRPEEVMALSHAIRGLTAHLPPPGERVAPPAPSHG
jgi:hypothetical protein